jgi:carboxymethylenebutenolidase
MSTIPRRQVLSALAVAPLAGLPLAAVLSDPRLARAAAAGLEDVTLTTQGGKTVKAALAAPAETPAPAIVLVHEWWGLNDQIKAVAAEFARQGYLALAVDLYDGNVATTPEDARAFMQAVKADEASDTLASWVAWLRGHAKAAGKVGTVGWCFGGGWSLGASIAAPVDATVVYYGRVTHPPEQLEALKGPVLGHYATRDQWINKDMVGGFEAAMRALGKPFESHWYEADHAFANPTGARYDEEDAKLAWQRTLAFFEANL